MKFNSILPQDIYASYLESVNEIKFTRREIDIISYLLSGKSAKTIAVCLSISPKTIEAHMHNIMGKVECNSRDGIIDFIERSKKLPFLKEHYLSLLINSSFEEQLSKVAVELGSEQPTCVIVYWRNHEYHTSLLHYLEKHLKLAGIKTRIEAREGNTLIKDPINKRESWKTKFVIYAVPEVMIEQEAINKEKGEITSFVQKLKETPNNIIALFPSKTTQNDLLQNLDNMECVYNLERENYYDFIFTVLKKLLPNINLDQIIVDFKNHYESICGISETAHKKSSQKDEPLLSPHLVPQWNGYIYDFFNIIRARKKPFIIGSFLGLVALCIGFLMLVGNKEGDSTQKQEWKSRITARADLSIPTNTILLKRPELMAQIDDKFKQQTGIQTLVLVGVGGAGKTTLARQYARAQDSPIVWEINAETPESLRTSFENFAINLSKSEKDNKILENIQSLKDPQKKKDKILSFIKEKLRYQSHWVIILDNVENFSDIQKFFPSDPIACGKGKIILTTRNKHLQQNNKIKASLFIGELNPQEKQDLFTRIMGYDKIQSLAKIKADETKEFLEKLPPYPLDISIAAYYLKATNISYLAYLNNLAHDNHDCAKIQEDLLKEAGDYTKTRYDIITLSLQRLIKENKDFRDLLLLISLLDSQNIPRDFLAKYKNDTIVDNLIYNLKKYSFISHKESGSLSEDAFSLHRSTQQGVLDFLINTTSLREKNDLISSMAHVLENYVDDLIEKEDYARMNLLVTHYDTFLSHRSILSDRNTKLLSRGAGQINFHLDNLKKAKEYLEQSLKNLNEDHSETSVQIAQSLAYLGMTHRELCNAEKAIKLLKKSLAIFNKHPESPHKTADAMGYLGLYYKDVDEHQEAINLLERCLAIYKKILPEYHPKKAKILVYLGMIHREIGNYEKAKDLFLKALTIYSKFPEYHIREAYASAFLGNVYRDLGNYKHSEKLLEKSLAIYKKTFAENPTKPLWVTVYLGKTQMALGHYDIAKKLFQESLKIYKECPGHFMEEAWTLENFGTLYRELGDYHKAKNLIEEANDIYKSHSYKNYIFVSSGLLNLGRVHADLGNYTLARNLIEKVLITHRERYGPDHTQTAQPLKYLGQVYLLEGSLEKAEELFLKSLEILQKNNHPEKYTVLENLGDLYLKKASLIDNAQNRSTQNFSNQAQSFLKTAYDIAKAHFPDDSAHIKRIQEKLKKFE